MTLSCNKHASLLIVNIIEHLLYAWSYTFTRMISFNFYNHPFKYYYYPHRRETKIEAQRSYITHPRSYFKWTNPDMNPG